jgi:integrase
MTQAADVFWELHASKKPSTDGFKSYLKRIREYFGTKWFDSVTHEDVESFLRWIRATPVHQERHKRTAPKQLASGTVNLHHTCLISVFNSIPKWAELGKIQRVKLPKQRNPASLVPKQSEQGSTRTRVLSQEELERLIGAATPRAGAIVKAAVFTLLRLNDLKRASVSLTATASAFRGVQTKTNKTYEIAANGYSLGDLDWTNFHREFEQAVKAANIKNFTFRDLRRTGATYLFRRTNDLGMVQWRLGHASPAMTKKYLGILDSDNVKASEILGGILNSLKPPVFEESAASTEKACAACGLVKPLHEFYKNYTHKDGRNSLCKVCSNENARIAMRNRRAVSSAVEHLPHTEGATGSSPVLPTTLAKFGAKFGAGEMLERRNRAKIQP